MVLMVDLIASGVVKLVWRRWSIFIK